MDLKAGARQKRSGGKRKVRGGRLEPEAALEMIEEFQGQCCAVWRDVA
jgi:hypothetical protein